MYLIVGILIFVALAVGAGVIMLFRKQWREDIRVTKTNDQIKAAIKQAVACNNSDFEQQLQSQFLPEDLTRSARMIANAKDQIKQWHDGCRENNAMLDSLIQEWNDARTTKDRLQAGRAVLHQIHKNGSSCEASQELHASTIQTVKDSMQQILDDHYQQLLSVAATDMDAYEALKTLFWEASRVWPMPELRSCDIELPVPPANWHQIVDQQVPNPSIKEYPGPYPENTGAVRLLAARALVTEDSATAKYLLALAPCKQSIIQARELSSTMLDQLAIVVARVQLKRESPTSTNLPR